MVQNAICRAGYHAKEEFDKLPPEVQNAVGSPNVLRQWARVEQDELATVVQSNFMRAFRARGKSDAAYAALPQDVKKQLEGITKNWGFKLIPGKEAGGGE